MSSPVEQQLTIKNLFGRDEVIWKPIPGYVGFYEASNTGEIRRVDGNVLKKYKGNYFTVALSLNGIPKTKAVHRLVAATFKGPSNLVVDHDDRDRYNNNESNLIYRTQRHNTSRNAVGYSANSNKYRKKFRVRIRINGKLIDFGSYYTHEQAKEVYQTKTKELCQAK